MLFTWTFGNAMLQGDLDLLMPGVLDNQSDVLVLSKSDSSSDVVRIGYIDGIVHEVSKRTS